MSKSPSDLLIPFTKLKHCVVDLLVFSFFKSDFLHLSLIIIETETIKREFLLFVRYQNLKT